MSDGVMVERVIQLVASAEALKVSVDHLNSVVTRHSEDIDSLRKSIDALHSGLIAHNEREGGQAKTINAVVSFLIWASTFGVISLVSGFVWLLLNRNPWLNVVRL